MFTIRREMSSPYSFRFPMLLPSSIKVRFRAGIEKED
jgi:hypothetical protein